jgi:aspartate/methionine/tyrosine aminotransferase
MTQINPYAQKLNDELQKHNSLFSFLSKKAKKAFFPKSGIITQSQEAKGKNINATIGIALKDDKTPACLQGIEKNILLDSADVFPYAPTQGIEELRQKWLFEIETKKPFH